MRSVLIILDNIRSAHNVGSIFRTADAAGVDRIYLCGITPAPIDRFGRVNQEIQKTSLGATGTVAWEQLGDSSDLATHDLLSLLRKLQLDGYSVVAVEQAAQSIDIFSFTAPEKVAYIFGAEVEGVQPKILDQVDMILEIPMAGMKESLNVSVVAGIVLFHRS